MSEKSVASTQFWLRRLHSITGFVFLGYFLCMHIREMDSIESPVLKWAFLWLPLAFHGLYGLYITYESRPNGLSYFWLRNWMYLAQRATALVLIVFIPVHFIAMNYDVTFTEASWYVGLWYVGLMSAIFHLANGIFGTLIDWGIAVGPYSQKVMVYVSFAAFFILSAYGLITLSNF